MLCEGLEPSSPDYKTGILAFEITEQIWQGHLESNQEWRNQNPWLYRLTIPQLIGSEGGNRTPTNGFGDRRTAIILPRNSLELGVGFEPTALEFCRLLHWATLPS